MPEDSENMSDDERQEMEYRAERDARWAPTVTDLIPPLIPQTIRDGPRNVRETVNDREIKIICRIILILQ